MVHRIQLTPRQWNYPEPQTPSDAVRCHRQCPQCTSVFLDCLRPFNTFIFDESYELSYNLLLYLISISPFLRSKNLPSGLVSRASSLSSRESGAVRKHCWPELLSNFITTSGFYYLFKK